MGLVWTPEAVAHMWERHGLTPDQANEVFDDPFLLTISSERNSQSGRASRYIGMCVSLDVLVVIGYCDDGQNYGATAWMVKSGRDYRAYREHRKELGG